MSEREDKMEERLEELGDEIEDVREDWERKQEDRSVPGAQKDIDEVETSRQELGEPPPADEDV